MNRPFPAFAALLALLALAMFAVSSTSRSTTVQPPRPHSGSSIGFPRPRDTNFIFIVPAPATEQNEPEAATRAVRENLEYAETCDEPPARDVFARSLIVLCQVDSLRTGLVGARIQIAEQVADAATRMPAIDCRSHHDPVHDRAVYGDAPARQHPPQAARGAAEPKLGEAELFSIFRDLGVAQRAVAATGSGSIGHIALATGIKLSSQCAALESWLLHNIECWLTNLGLLPNQTPLDSTAIVWGDYAELIDGALTPPAATAVLATSWDAPRGVRFGDWLRHSAASSLQICGGLLQAAAIELDTPNLPFAAPGLDTLTR